MIVIKCPEHPGTPFSQNWNHHLQGEGCPDCAPLSSSLKQRSTKEEFIQRCLAVHPDGDFDYSDVVYINSRTKVPIKCLKHGDYFFQIPNNHTTHGQGCPVCNNKNMSENCCRKIFEEMFDGKFINIRPNFLKGLELDGYNEKLKLAFEYNGIQHYEFQKFFHRTNENFIAQQIRDVNKIQWCKDEGIILIIIPHQYTYKNPELLRKYIEDKLIELNLCINIDIDIN